MEGVMQRRFSSLAALFLVLIPMAGWADEPAFYYASIQCKCVADVGQSLLCPKENARLPTTCASLDTIVLPKTPFQASPERKEPPPFDSYEKRACQGYPLATR